MTESLEDILRSIPTRELSAASLHDIESVLRDHASSAPRPFRFRPTQLAACAAAIALMSIFAIAWWTMRPAAPLNPPPMSSSQPTRIIVTAFRNPASSDSNRRSWRIIQITGEAHP